jgi:peptidoglycan/LPS O-acetylase OafA/YrhL
MLSGGLRVFYNGILMESKRDLLIDYIRGVAAFSVVIGHVRAMYFGGLPNTASIIESFFYFFTGFATHAVYVFFGLSGYLLGGIVKKYSGNSFTLLQQFIRRILRLWVVLVPSLLFTLICHYFLSPDILAGNYREVWQSGPSNSSGYSIDATTFLTNLFFLNEYFGLSYGINSPLWSLSFEATFYVSIFAICSSNRSIVMLPVVVAVAILLYFNSHMIGGAVVFTIGALLKAFFKTTMNLRKSILCLLLFLIIMVCSRIMPEYNFGFFPLIGVFSILVVHYGSVLRSIPVLKWLSSISYSLYMVHFPVIAVMYSYVEPSILTAAFAVILSLVVGHGFWFCFERHTPFLYKKMRL